MWWREVVIVVAGVLRICLQRFNEGPSSDAKGHPHDSMQMEQGFELTRGFWLGFQRL